MEGMSQENRVEKKGGRRRGKRKNEDTPVLRSTFEKSVGGP